MGDPHGYDLATVKIPRLQGGMLRLVVWMLEHPPARELIRPALIASGGFTAQRARLLDDPPTFLPSLPAGPGGPPAARPPAEAIGAVAPPSGRGFSFATARDYLDAYRSGRSTPEEVAERALAAVRESDAGERPLRLFIAVDREDVLRQARESARRWHEGRPLGALDGVPVAVKDELDATPYPTTVGTRFLGRERAAGDATAVARLRAAGALILGKANMHEIGMGVTGQNPHHGTARNPYDASRHTGGSSSGPAAAVAAGLCPLAVGCDGGGSIRIPSAMCGVVGLKATWGRVSEHGAAPITWSMGHVGPIGATALDAALGYAVMAGPDPRDPASLAQPPVELDAVGRDALEGLRLGVYRPWFRHAQAGVVERCERLLDAFRERGARIVDVTVPELDAVRVAHSAIITTEMNAALAGAHAAHRADYALDSRLLIATTLGLTGTDYLHALKQRTRLLRSLESTFREVDGIVTPATAVVAPPIVPSSLRSGSSDVALLAEIMRFALVANLSGYPAVSFPAGYDDDGLPVGLQVMGRPWEEGRLLAIALASESIVERRQPAVHWRLLP